MFPFFFYFTYDLSGQPAELHRTARSLQSQGQKYIFYLCEMPAAGVLFLLGLVLAAFMSPELV